MDIIPQCIKDGGVFKFLTSQYILIILSYYFLINLYDLAINFYNNEDDLITLNHMLILGGYSTVSISVIALFYHLSDIQSIMLYYFTLSSAYLLYFLIANSISCMFLVSIKWYIQNNKKGKKVKEKTASKSKKDTVIAFTKTAIKKSKSSNNNK